ncbi:MAG: HK97 gp10 family phage protein [Singulisphaera sp.]
MFKLTEIRLRWNGDAVKAGLERRGREGARLAAEYVAERARFYCPVDSGELKASIQVISGGDGAVWQVVATAEHAGAVEFGSMRGDTFIPPDPFLRRALADGRREFPAILKEALVTAGEGRLLEATIPAAT